MFYLEAYQLNLYRHHLYLLKSREESAKTRFGILRFDIKIVSSSLCLYADMLHHLIEEAQFASSELINFQANMQALCATLQELDQQTHSDWQSLTEEDAQANLALYWEKYDVVESMFVLARQSGTVESDIARILRQSHSLVEILERNANMMWALYDVLINPGKMKIADEIVQLEKLIRDAQTKAKAGDAEGLETLIEASVSTSEYFRHIAAAALQYFKDDRAVAMLMHLLFDQREYIRGVAASSLAQLKARMAVPLLIEALDQDFKHDHNLGMIAEALAAIPDQRAVEPLVKVLENLERRLKGLGDRQEQPLAGIYHALKVIGGEKANEAIQRYFGS